MISNIYIKDFIHLDEFRWNETAGVNVVIGENDTGKTSLLKILYATTRAWTIFTANAERGVNDPFKDILAKKIFNVFQPRNNGIGELVSKGGVNKLSLEIVFFAKTAKKQTIRYSFGSSSERKIVDCTENIDPCAEKNYNSLFIPPKEVLTSWQAIKSTRKEDSWQYGFDDTYIDLIDAVLDNGRSGALSPSFQEVKKALRELFNGEIKPPSGKESDFIFTRKKAKFTMGVTAEGIKKIGIYARLINNRNLNGGTVLFLDEPEAVLHPKAIKQLAEIIYLFSKAGVQVFVNTHSFFLLKQLEIISKRENQFISCCSLSRASDEKVQASFVDLRDGLPNNPIIETALSIFDEEIELQQKL